MRSVRYVDSQGAVQHGHLEDGIVHELDRDFFSAPKRTGRHRPLADVRLLPPVSPSKIIGVGLNYAGHAAEHHIALPPVPKLFFKPPSALVTDGDTIRLADVDHHVNEEAELVVVIGRRARRVDASEAFRYILGYTCGNDVSDRDTQAQDGNWTARAKGHDTYAPIGNAIEDEFDPSDAAIRAIVNGREVQSSTTADLVYDIPTLVSFISSVFTLEPGDLIFTGTPSGVTPLRPGDIVEIRIDGLGTLTNPVGRADDPDAPIPEVGTAAGTAG